MAQQMIADAFVIACIAGYLVGWAYAAGADDLIETIREVIRDDGERQGERQRRD